MQQARLPRHEVGTPPRGVLCCSSASKTTACSGKPYMETVTQIQEIHFPVWLSGMAAEETAWHTHSSPPASPSPPPASRPRERDFQKKGCVATPKGKSFFHMWRGQSRPRQLLGWVRAVRDGGTLQTKHKNPQRGPANAGGENVVV